ncbi:hypothetical protein [Jannaschia seohaensis]|uniref:Uncharacterized protein n=1 Tax=Jannaschia seohaensis TaxID=475081 RepID=A0A2Y9ANG7_9RHOB|nr:hypothetical protein [Jannaschia seohaensis]PWJ19248.1 hypothetical protein BCF38_104182 [Jannaschia seohaensis]SSA45910.1 hypothetical protein SAMN05421539_104182 [Jannaschia seohaensis]
MHQGGNVVIADGALPRVRPTVTELSDGDLFFAWQENRNGNREVIAREVAPETLTEGSYEQIPITQFYVKAEIVDADTWSYDTTVGETLSVSGRIGSNVALAGLSIQWFVSEGTKWVPIEGATGRRFTPTEDLAGETVTVGATLTFENGIVAETLIDDDGRWVVPAVTAPR